MSRIDDYLETLVGKEGGYSDHPADKGGPTRWGVTEAVARAFGYRGAMRDLPRGTALDIFRARYWRQPGFEQIEAIDAPIAERLLDVGVNMGPGTAGRDLQRWLNVLNDRGGLYSDITVDGACGAMTRAALKALIARRGPEARGVMLFCLQSGQAGRYREIMEGNPSQEAFGWGWIARRAFAA